ncbi:SpoIIE family protein phosphatase [Clostridium sp. AWRP]|uniref:SpoIIE family protein phosphatase n=1 Tax=Clostridium sp. AWRP TaxID=2212991 RepID=UPI000FDF72C9|nr:SpoIIE family protein phosphatase [Clostridium sp. AWRP]AZV58263.1 hypothetical protein DMR38_17640 [Clostridium sp. AWRP]
MPNVDFGMCVEALLESEEECGDIAVMKKYKDHCFVALIDVLGHGSEARKVALLAKKYLEYSFENEVTEIMNGLHYYLKGTRGAVAAVCQLNISTGKLTYAGIGNIIVRIFGAKPMRFTPKDGIVGYIMASPEKHTVKLYPNDILIMHSDGIKEHFDALECADLLKKNSEDIACGILKKFGKENDDASCVVLKYSV